MTHTLARRLALAGCFALAMLLAGCATREPHRSCQTTMPGLPDGVPTEACASDNRLFEQAERYSLHFTEFDDQGWVHDDKPNAGQAPAQIDRVMQHLGSLLRDQGSAVRLYVYVHGWRHSAAAGDPDVAQFRSFLATRAQRTPDERVVGIFVGWRGLPIERLPLLQYLTFWDRKGTAERVAQGSVRELFARLRALKRVDLNRPDSAKPRLLTFVLGHSFGASIAYRSVSQALLGGFADELDNPVQQPVQRLFEAVVLVNPAIEAAPFEPLYRVARQRLRPCVDAAPGPGQAADCQAPLYAPPALLVFTSRGDWATRVAFPIGTQLGNLFQAESSPRQRQANRQTIGWDSAYRTHTLGLPSSGCNTPPPSASSPPIGSADGLAYAPAGWSACLPTGRGLARLLHLGADGSTGSAPVFNGPIWNVLVDAALIGDHDDVWNPAFTQVLDALFGDFSNTRDNPGKRRR